MECYISKVKVPMNGENNFCEMYAYVYHTGDEVLDSKLNMYGDCDGNKITCNVELSYELRDHTKTHNLHVIDRGNYQIEVYSDHVALVMKHFMRNIKFVTKEDFAILKMLLCDRLYFIFLDPGLEYFVMHDDIICGLSTSYIKDQILLRKAYLSTKYSFSYTHIECLPFTGINLETIVKFSELIDKFIATPDPVVEKIRKVQIFLMADGDEIPCFFPKVNRTHKLVIENTFKIIENDDLQPILDRYINKDEKLPELLPIGMKKA